MYNLFRLYGLILFRFGFRFVSICGKFVSIGFASLRVQFVSIGFKSVSIWGKFLSICFASLLVEFLGREFSLFWFILLECVDWHV